MRTIILGDVHLGSPLCRTGQLLEVLERVPYDRLILNGDIFDDLNFRRLRRQHWLVMEKLRHQSQRREIIWIRGNHDGSASVLRHLLGVPILKQFTFTFRGEKVYVIHGDEFDDFQSSVKKMHRLRSLRDIFYGFAIWFDVPRKAAIQWAQRSTYVFARSATKVRNKAVEKGRSLNARWVVAGHTHHREVSTHSGVTYLNPSSWLTSNPAYVLFDDSHDEPRLVVMGSRHKKTLGRTVRTRVRKARRRMKKRLNTPG
jgi:UDP-2,3-diacylglucosamine pyrophosphatase LpxH